jgi:lipopolysaccharide transport system permease protein
MSINKEDEWSEVISPRKKWFEFRFGEMWRYKFLIFLFVRRDFVAIYKQTILGPLWHIIQPLLTTITFTIVFGRIAQMSTDGQPQFIFYMAGVTIWNYFAECINKTSTTFIDNASVFGKVYFPRLAVPVAVVISGLLAFTVQFILFSVFYLYFYFNGASLQPSIYLLAIPFLLVIMAVLGLGLGIIISALTTRYRDLRFLVTFGVQLLMYASAVIYPLSSVTGVARTILSFNPLVPVIESFRFAFFGTGTFDWQMLAYSAGVTMLIFIIGVSLFHRVEKTFMDTV